MNIGITSVMVWMTGAGVVDTELYKPSSPGALIIVKKSGKEFLLYLLEGENIISQI